MTHPETSEGPQLPSSAELDSPHAAVLNLVGSSRLAQKIAPVFARQQQPSVVLQKNLAEPQPTTLGTPVSSPEPGSATTGDRCWAGRGRRLGSSAGQLACHVVPS